jgi:hypothetical protein
MELEKMAIQDETASREPADNAAIEASLETTGSSARATA